MELLAELESFRTTSGQTDKAVADQWDDIQKWIQNNDKWRGDVERAMKSAATHLGARSVRCWTSMSSLRGSPCHRKFRYSEIAAGCVPAL